MAMLAAAVLVLISLAPQTVQTAKPIRIDPAALHVRPLPDAAVRFHARINPKLTPSARAKINSLAASFREQLSRSPQAWPPGILDGLYASAHNSFPNAAPADIDSIVEEVMMQVSQDQEADLQAQLNAMQANLKHKDELRKEQTAQETALHDQSQPTTATKATTTTTPPNRPTLAPDASLDSMNEMSEMTSMRLQMAMDRRSKFVEALSNIMKKIDSTQETIIQNLK
jgi:hypothetical protein